MNPVAAAWSRAGAALYEPFLALGERRGMAVRRHELVASARGRVLEIGAGTGLNLEHYPDDVDALVLTEPDPAMARRLERRTARVRPEATVLRTGAEALPVPDGSFDTVVSTMVLCTVPHSEDAVAELRRVLRPGGRLLFVEHLRADDAARARTQDRLDAPWRAFAAGCNCNRPTLDLLAAAFDLGTPRRDAWRGMPRIVQPLAIGAAVRTPWSGSVRRRTGASRTRPPGPGRCSCCRRCGSATSRSSGRSRTCASSSPRSRGTTPSCGTTGSARGSRTAATTGRRSASTTRSRRSPGCSTRSAPTTSRSSACRTAAAWPPRSPRGSPNASERSSSSARTGTARTSRRPRCARRSSRPSARTGAPGRACSPTCGSQGARLEPLAGDIHPPWLGDRGAVVRAVSAFLGSGDAAAIPSAPAADGLLSAREREILALAAEGLTDAQIAERLVLSPHTIHRHMADVRLKLDQPSRGAAAAHAVRHGLI